MTVTDLIKKLQQYQQIGQIAAVRIEFGDGSIYDDSPLSRYRPPVRYPRVVLPASLRIGIPLFTV